MSKDECYGCNYAYKTGYGYEVCKQVEIIKTCKEGSPKCVKKAAFDFPPPKEVEPPKRLSKWEKFKLWWISG
jgi:hypothetical protein